MWPQPGFRQIFEGSGPWRLQKFYVHSDTHRLSGYHELTTKPGCRFCRGVSECNLGGAHADVCMELSRSVWYPAAAAQGVLLFGYFRSRSTPKRQSFFSNRVRQHPYFDTNCPRWLFFALLGTCNIHSHPDLDLSKAGAQDPAAPAERFLGSLSLAVELSHGSDHDGHEAWCALPSYEPQRWERVRTLWNRRFGIVAFLGRGEYVTVGLRYGQPWVDKASQRRFARDVSSCIVPQELIWKSSAESQIGENLGTVYDT
jgi:hypothetical protein